MDGDADRIVFFAKSNENDDLLLLDGDKIAVLIAHVLQPLVRTLDANLTMGVVQTAYANGESTKYLKVCVSVSYDSITLYSHSLSFSLVIVAFPRCNLLYANQILASLYLFPSCSGV